MCRQPLRCGGAQNESAPAESNATVDAEAICSRRTALELILGGALAALGAICLRPVGSRGGVSQEQVAVADLSELPQGSAVQASFGGQPLLVIRPNGENAEDSGPDVRAFSAICTHEGCLVGWNAEQQTIRCPCHGGVFDTNGEVVEGPPPASLYTFDVAIRDGQIFITGA